MPARVGFELAGGGPTWRALKRWHVVDPPHRVRGAALLVAAIGLGPVVAFGLYEWATTGIVPSVLRDVSLYARFLLAAPALLLGDIVLGERCARALNRFVDGEFYESADCLERVKAIAARAERLRESTVVEVLLFVVALVGAQFALFGHSSTVRDAWAQLTQGPGEIYYALVTVPIYQVLVWRWLYRWGIWSGVLWRISRLPLRPLAAHPDRAGGLALFSEPTIAFAFFVLAMSIVISARWVMQILGGDATLSSFKALFAIFVGTALLLAFAPLMPFVPHLYRARFDGVRDYGALAVDHSRRFYRRWIVGVDGETSPLGTPDISSWCDLGTAYGELQRMRLIPFGPRFVIVILVAAFVPMLPLIATQIPLIVLLGKLGKTMLGGLPG